MAFDFPSTPATGQIYQPAGGPAFMYDGEKWKGGQVAGPQKEQFFDIAGRTVQDIPVPTWAKIAVITAVVTFSATSNVILRVSGDGTTFAAGAAEYLNAGPLHNSGTPTYTTIAPVNSAGMPLSNSVDNINFPHNISAELSLQRANTGDVFSCKSHSMNYHSAGAHYTTWYANAVHAATLTSLTIKALRFIFGTAKAGSYIHIRWLGDDAQVPISNAIVDAPSDGNEYVRANGVWRLKERTYPLAGVAQQDIAVPTGATAIQLVGHDFISGADTFELVQISFDGTTFITTEYFVAGPLHATGTSGYSKQDVALSLAGLYLSFGGNSPSVQRNFTMDLPLVRPDAGKYFTGRVHSIAYDGTTPLLYRTVWLTSGYYGGGGTAIKALRIKQASGLAFAAGQAIAKWSY